MIEDLRKMLGEAPAKKEFKEDKLVDILLKADDMQEAVELVRAMPMHERSKIIRRLKERRNLYEDAMRNEKYETGKDGNYWHVNVFA